MFDSVVSDIHWTALQIGTVTILLNAATASRQDWTMRTWGHVLQDNAQVMQLALRFVGDKGIPASQVGSIERMYVEFAEASKVSRTLFMQRVPYNAEQRHSLSKLLVGWLGLCKTMLGVLQCIEQAVRTRLSERYVQNGEILASYLREACSGSSRRVNSWGEIAVPVLANRRRSPRVKVVQPCRVFVNGKPVRATLKDASRHGLNVECSTSVSDREKVSVELQDGRVLRATVVRANGDVLGLYLETPLSFNDPLWSLA